MANRNTVSYGQNWIKYVPEFYYMTGLTDYFHLYKFISNIQITKIHVNVHFVFDEVF